MPGSLLFSPGSRSVRSRIYRALYETRDFCSRQQLAERCGISMPTLFQNLSELMDSGLVRSSGEERSTGGRRAQGLELVPNARIAVGISIMEAHIHLTALDLRMDELAFRVLPLRLASRLDEAAGLLADSLESFLDDYRLEREKLLGVGIALPGMLTHDRSRIFMAPPLGLRDVPLEVFTRDIPYPVHAENDASCSGHMEYFVRGGMRNMAYFSLENGVGGAVILGGRPYNGSNGRSGEFGHICVEPGGAPCRCGRRGCLEAYCTTRRIPEEFGVSLPEFFRGIEEHNPEYEALLYDMLRHLATAINAVRMSLDCGVVLGGLLTEYLPPYLPVLRRYVVSGNPFDRDGDFLRLSTLRRHIAPLGAALYFVRDFVNSV